MRDGKLRLGILFGGKSAEHEISLISAKNVIETLDTEKYEVVLIGIDKQGQWHVRDSTEYLLNADQPEKIALAEAKMSVSLSPSESKKQPVSSVKEALHLDVVFPILHGPYGEEGSVQGFLKLVNVPCVGAGILGSALGMDKDVTKRLLKEAGIAVADFVTIHRHERDLWSFGRICQKWSPPFFIKPSGLGSSIGIAKVETEEGFEKALDDAFQYDRKVLVEQFVPGREIVCAVLGNEYPITSIPGEIVPHHEFYSYQAKYLDEHGATYHIPANISSESVKKVQELAIAVYRTLCCEGMARIDFFLKEDGTLIVNELNSIPGFTRFSTYPRLWEASGISCGQLLDRLIELALEKHRTESELKTSV